LGVVDIAVGYALKFCAAPAGSSRPSQRGTIQATQGCPGISDSPNLKNRKELAMNWDRVEGNWKEFKGSVQQKWGKLTKDDLDVVEGKRTELIGRLQQRYGYARDQAEKEVDTWLKEVA
jgi:uncharacterized protein YjbJ (UPF0337 family)